MTQARARSLLPGPLPTPGAPTTGSHSKDHCLLRRSRQVIFWFLRTSMRVISHMLLTCWWPTEWSTSMLSGMCAISSRRRTTPSRSKVGFFEVYGQGGQQGAALHNPGLNVGGLEVLDLRTLKPDGTPWEFTLPKGKAWALRLVREQQPRWIIPAPPCTTCSILNWNLNYRRMPQHEVDRRIAEGMIHLECVARLYAFPSKTGGYFLHEHPRDAKSWKDPPIQHLLHRRDVHLVRCDQCRFGALTAVCESWKGGQGKQAPVLKPTRFMSNSMPMLRRLHGLCPRDHAHRPLLEGRAASAAFCPCWESKVSNTRSHVLRPHHQFEVQNCFCTSGVSHSDAFRHQIVTGQSFINCFCV